MSIPQNPLEIPNFFDVIQELSIDTTILFEIFCGRLRNQVKSENARKLW